MREQLREILDQVSRVPMRECVQDEVAILLGAIGLELYAAYSKLIQIEVEFRHAPEYLDSGRRTDVEETMQMNGEVFASMKCKFKRRSGELLAFREKDKAFCEPVSALLLMLAKEAGILAEYKLGTNAREGADGYLQHLREVIGALKEYLGLAIGNTLIWEKK